jgi:hypothetical protein
MRIHGSVLCSARLRNGLTPPLDKQLGVELVVARLELGLLGFTRCYKVLVSQGQR